MGVNTIGIRTRETKIKLFWQRNYFSWEPPSTRMHCDYLKCNIVYLWKTIRKCIYRKCSDPSFLVEHSPPRKPKTVEGFSTNRKSYLKWNASIKSLVFILFLNISIWYRAANFYTCIVPLPLFLYVSGQILIMPTFFM